ncbi:MAG TPA: endo alpha-1,4 polygalactosaminidase [Actinomycetota bacterium]|nr:endo alpha-1,4 polygalactosaminidase [Actinomycetota bacterium]
MRRIARVMVMLTGLALAGPVAVMPTAAAHSLPDPLACDGCYASALETSWQWQLQGSIDTSIDVEMYDIDGFDTKKSLVTDLHDDGRMVVCYISAGSWEDWRPDADDFPNSVLGHDNGWPGEKWLDIRKLGILRPIMRARLDMCADKGFDAVEFDNVDGYQNNTGFPLDGHDQLHYNIFLANQAHARDLSAVLKNDLGQVEELLPYFDFALTEQCFQYDECDKLTPFVDAGKAVFGVEYKLHRPEFCPEANAMNFNFLRKKLSLKVWRLPCR